MDTNWIEYLLPIIFFVLYGISKLFGKGENQEVDSPASPPGDIGEQQRRIQEEIRRRIAERRAETKPAQSTQTLKPEPPKIDRQPAPPRSPFREPELDVPQVAPQRMPDPAVLDMQQQLAAQMERLRKAKANTKSDTFSQSIRRGAPKNAYAIGKKRSKFRSEISSMLKDAQRAKKAFLYSEIFGAPMGQRRQSTFAPLIDQ